MSGVLSNVITSSLYFNILGYSAPANTEALFSGVYDFLSYTTKVTIFPGSRSFYTHFCGQMVGSTDNITWSGLFVGGMGGFQQNRQQTTYVKTIWVWYSDFLSYFCNRNWTLTEEEPQATWDTMGDTGFRWIR